MDFVRGWQGQRERERFDRLRAMYGQRKMQTLINIGRSTCRPSLYALVEVDGVSHVTVKSPSVTLEYATRGRGLVGRVTSHRMRG